MTQFRQGDVFLESVQEIPATATKAKSNILAVGESQNHAHAIFGEADVLTDGDELYLSVNEEAQLKHILLQNGIATDRWTSEHHDITLPPGKYKFVQQRQYDPYKRAAEAVRD